MTVKVINIQPPSTAKSNPLNPLSKNVRIHLHKCLEEAYADPKVTSIVLFGGANFSAGADITEFSAKGKDPQKEIEGSKEIPSLEELTRLIENSSKPIVAAVTGVALGGGCEIALSCHFRVAHAKARMGLPETKIGLIPGAGGTQRLPRLSKDIKFTLNVITTGRMVGMSEAKSKRVIDDVVDGGLQDVVDKAKKWAEYGELMGDISHKKSCNQKVVAEDDARGLNSARFICDQVAKKLPHPERGGEAVHGALKAVRASFEKNFDDAMEVESEIFWDLLLNSSQGRGLRHAFFAERTAQKGNAKLLKGPVAAAFLDKKPAQIGVIGAGTMGAGIATCFLRAGCKVILVDVNEKGLQRGVQTITKIFEQDVAKKRMKPTQAKHILSKNFSHTTDMSKGDFSKCLVVVEAVFENLQIKQSIFSQLDKIIQNPQALLLSNTSTLSIDSIASALSEARRPYCAGMHFFSPAHIMKLVEIVVSSTTSPETTALVQFITSKTLRKVGVTVGNCQGFVGNRMVNPYSSEAVFMLEEGGASVPEVDKAIYDFGMAMGPLVMGDLAGNDIGYLIAKSKGLTKDPKTGKPGKNRTPGMRYSDLGDDIVVKLGRIGMKAPGKGGWYDYNPKVGKGRQPLPSKEVAEFVKSYVKKVPRAKYTPNEIVERALFGLVNEGFKILEENIAQKPSDIDVIYLYGYGFPAFRGGPMYWIDNEVGLPYFLKRLCHFQQQFPGSAHYVPSKLLKKCVALGIGLEDFYAKGLHLNKSTSKL